MSNIYSYAFTSDGTGPWWGIRCSKRFYENTIRQMQETTRCFVYLTNSKGETLAIAVEGPHNETAEDAIFAPDWVFTRLGITDSDEVTMDPILESLPRGDSVKIRPVTGSTVEGPMFLEGLTEALNQLGVVQEGVLSAIVDQSMPVLHDFVIEDLSPARVCLADGELRVDLERALDRPETPVESESEPEYQSQPAFQPANEQCCEDSMASFIPGPVAKKGYVPFGGTGYRLDGK